MQPALVIWRLTDGKPGHMQQTLGLTQALAARTPCQIFDVDVRAQAVGVGDFLRGRFLAGAHLPAPDFILGAGHATHWALLAARRAYGGRTVVLMKPSLPAFLFDVVIAPEHDGLRASDRVINTRGVLNPMQAGEKIPGSVLFLIGGPSKHVQWDDAVILQQLQTVLAALPAATPWLLSDSRRTPESLRVQLQQTGGEHFQAAAHCPPGWLAAQLAQTETVWVSEDSVSMVYEALTAGCRVGLLQLPASQRHNRVMRGVETLLAQQRVTGFAQWSQGQAFSPVEKFDEAARVAAVLLARL